MLFVVFFAVRTAVTAQLQRERLMLFDCFCREYSSKLFSIQGNVCLFLQGKRQMGATPYVSNKLLLFAVSVAKTTVTFHFSSK